MYSLFNKITKIFSKKRLKIFSSLIISFFISSIIFNYSTLQEKPIFATEKMVNELSLLKDRISSLFTLQGINFSLNNFPTTVPRPTNQQQNINPTTVVIPTEEAEVGEIEPTISYSFPKVTSNLIPTIKPTVKPTTKPSPTIKKIPTPTIVNKVVRPGTSWDEIIKITSQKTCVPQAMIKAISVEEAGTVANFNATQIKFYNSYNWWNDKKTTIETIHIGFGYNTCTNQIPEDSKFAGEYINGKQAYGLCVRDMKIFGPMQTSEDGWNKSKSRVISALKSLKVQADEKTVDRRVFLDGFLAGGFTIKDYSYIQSCSGWDASVVETVARRYYGKCEYNVQGRAGNYCYEVCLKYNYYGGSANCSQTK